MNTLSGTEEKLVGLIDRHAGHLSDLANHLLLTAKLDGGDLKIKREQVDVAKLIQRTITESSQELDGHSIDFQVTSEHDAVYARMESFFKWLFSKFSTMLQSMAVLTLRWSSRFRKKKRNWSSGSKTKARSFQMAKEKKYFNVFIVALDR